MHRSALLSVSAAAMLLSACSGAVDHPSLAPRPIERPAAATPPEGESRVPVDAPEVARAVALVEEARSADRAFRDALASAKRAIRAGGGAPAGSEAWVAAQQALSRLDVLRGPITRALADVDRLATDAVRAGRAPDPRVEQAMRDVMAFDNAARDEIAGLAGGLSRP